MTETGRKTAPVNQAVPSSARIYDYVLGGKDHYPVDRDAAEKVVAAFPTVRVAARQNRNFMHRAVNEITAAGVTQFLDIGTGIPTEPNLHQVAQAAQHGEGARGVPAERGVRAVAEPGGIRPVLRRAGVAGTGSRHGQPVASGG
jgi:hypothetical protein